MGENNPYWQQVNAARNKNPETAWGGREGWQAYLAEVDQRIKDEPWNYDEWLPADIERRHAEYNASRAEGQRVDLATFKGLWVTGRVS